MQAFSIASSMRHVLVNACKGSLLNSPPESLSLLRKGLFANYLPTVGGFFYGQTRLGSRHGGFEGYRKDYNIMKEPPVGPHKPMPPHQKHDGRKGESKNYRYIVHYPEDGKYTIKKLAMTCLGGRDQVTGRKIIQGVRKGHKRRFRWIDWWRLPKDWDPNGPDLIERVLRVSYDPNRKAMIALTGYEDKLRWQIATENMKKDDIIRTSAKIPIIPVKPTDGDSYPLGALPVGTTICLVQWAIGTEERGQRDAEECSKIVRKSGDRVIIELCGKRKLQYSLDQRCQCVVGKVSIHPLKKCPILSPNRARWMGIGPRSGLWHRKTGHRGRKIKALPPVKEINPLLPEKDIKLLLHCDSEGIRGAPLLRKRKFDLNKW